MEIFSIYIYPLYLWNHYSSYSAWTVSLPFPPLSCLCSRCYPFVSSTDCCWPYTHKPAGMVRWLGEGSVWGILPVRLTNLQAFWAAIGPAQCTVRMRNVQLTVNKGGRQTWKGAITYDHTQAARVSERERERGGWRRRGMVDAYAATGRLMQLV